MADTFIKPIPDIWHPGEGDFAKWLYDLWDYLNAHPIPSGDEIGEVIDAYLKDHPIDAPVQSVNGKKGAVQISLQDLGGVTAQQAAAAAPVQTVNGKKGAVQISLQDLGGVTAQQAAAAAPVQSVNGEKGAVTITLAALGGVTQQQAAAAAPVQSVNGRTGAVGNLLDFAGGYELTPGSSVSVPAGFSSIFINPLFEGTLPAGNKGYRTISMTPEYVTLFAGINTTNAHFPTNVARRQHTLSIEYGPFAEPLTAQSVLLFVYCFTQATFSME